MDVMADHKTCPTCQGSFPPEVEVCPRDGSPLQEPGEWSVGQVIQGKYVIFREAEGDLAASVYRARALEFDEPRMLRVLRAPLAANVEAAGEFRRTARVLERLAHRNVVAVEGTAEAEDGRPYVVTESVEGRTLDDALRAEGPLPAGRACKIALQIAAALEAVHRTGLLHLALEPGNVVLSGAPGDERAQVQGLGSAYARLGRARRLTTAAGGEAAPLTLRELMPSAPAYSAPEQALGGDPELLDGRADLYALGVLLYQMLTGRLPLEPAEAPAGRDAAALAWLSAHLCGEPRPLAEQERGGEIPRGLSELVMGLLQKRLELRPPTAQAVVNQLELVLGELSSRAALQPQLHRAPAKPSAKPQGPAEPELAPLMPAADSRLADVTLNSGPGLQAASAGGAPAAPEAGAGTLATPAGDGLGETGAGGALYTSPIFRLPPPKPGRVRWILAVASTAVVVAGAWFFMTRARTQWLGAGPASPIKSDELRQVEGAGANATPQGAIAAPQNGAASQSPASQSAGSPASQSAGSPAKGANPAAAPPGSAPTAPPTAGPSARSPQAGPPAAHIAQSASAPKPRAASSKPAPAKPAAPPGPDRGEIAAQVQRAVDAGDVFFGLGQYDLAIQAYEVPLKLDPGNKVLRGRIARARRAKTAEQEYLGQP